MIGRNRRSRTGCRPKVESLDPRVLLASQVVPDPTFGVNGLVVADIASITNGTIVPLQVTDSAVMPDGRIVVIGQSVGGATGDVMIARFLPNGLLDPTFGPNGLGVEALDLGRNEVPTALAIYPGNRILIGGTTLGLSGTDANIFVMRLNVDGSYDTTFGSSGFTQTFFQAQFSYLSDLVLLPDFTFLTAGFAASGPTTNDRSFAIAKYGIDGRLINTFGLNGQVLTSIQGRSTAANAIVLQPDGRFVVAGSSSLTPVATTGLDVALARYFPNGQLDPTFGFGGLAVSPFSVFDDAANDLALTSDGKYVVAGYVSTSNNLPNNGNRTFSARYLANGAIDPTYAAGNAAYGTNGQAVSVALQPAGKVLTSGQFFQNNIGFFAELTRFTGAGTLDPSFSSTGSIVTRFSATSTSDGFVQAVPLNGGRILATAQVRIVNNNLVGIGLARYVSTSTKVQAPGDFDGDGLSDVSVYLTALAAEAYRPSGGGADVVTKIGATGQSVPAPGDYDGDGRADIAVFNPATAVFTIRPSGGGAVRTIQFGAPGASAVATGDFDGDGRTDIGVYIGNRAIFAYRPSRGGPDVLASFGTPNRCIPAVGDYDGDGRSDIAIYFRSNSVFAYRPSRGGADVLTQFGPAGQSRPTPGDYDGDGKTDFSVYIPGRAVYAYRPSRRGADVQTSFGTPSVSIPVPGDYDGDGKTDLAVFNPGNAAFIYRPSTAPAAGDIAQQFGSGNNGSQPVLEPNATLPTSATTKVKLRKIKRHKAD